MKVMILGGGKYAEREVSLRSANAVKLALETAGYKTEMIDTGANTPNFSNFQPDETIVFPILHGAGGEDGLVGEGFHSDMIRMTRSLD